MTERRSITGGNNPTNQVITDLKGIRLIFGSPSSVNNHGSDVNNLTLAPGQFHLTQINRNSNKLHQAVVSSANASAGQAIIRTIAPTKISTLTRSTGLTAATILQQAVSQQQPAGGQQSTQAKIVAHQQQSSSSPPQKIFIQAVNMNASGIQKVVKPQVQKSLFAISSGSTSNIIINNNGSVSSTNNSGTQLYRVIGTQQGQIKTAGPLVKHTQAGLANKSKSLSIVNPSQVVNVTKLTQQPITSQRLILPATNQVQVAIAASPAMFQGISAPTSVSYITTPVNQTHQGFAFVQTPTVITPSNQHSALSDSSGASSENSSNVKLESHASNENLNRGSSRQQNQQQPLHWLNEPIPTVRQRKPCNCTKSQCLKLYCECFANGEFCKDCNCCNCANNLEHEEERTRAIKSCMERNPHAFHPKIGKGGNNRHHNKGCNCKRSGCLKNYCECYEAKILCSNLCRCIGCRNYEESVDRQKLMQLADAAEVRVQQQTAAESKLSLQILGSPVKPQAISSNGQRPPYTFVTLDVIEAIGSCLIAEADDSQLSDVLQERQILEEFGRCLSQVIEMASKTRASSP